MDYDNQTLHGNIVRDNAGNDRCKRKNPWCIKHFLLYKSTPGETIENEGTFLRAVLSAFIAV